MQYYDVYGVTRPMLFDVKLSLISPTNSLGFVLYQHSSHADHLVTL